MAQFGYRKIHKMEPRPGRSYATEYYQQSPAERERTEQWIARAVERVAEVADETPGGWEELAQPLKKFRRRETQGHYSAMDIMTDMLQQLSDHKDIPSGMLGRWNRLMAPYGLAIDLIPETDLPTNPFDITFGEQDA
jgi:hypothetical protein